MDFIFCIELVNKPDAPQDSGKPTNVKRIPGKSADPIPFPGSFNPKIVPFTRNPDFSGFHIESPHPRNFDRIRLPW
jgi:hypothetical protein